MIILADVIQTLRPGIGFVMYDNDPKTIIWDDPKVVTPTDEEIDKAYAEAKAEADILEIKKVEVKAALLERLGITEDEAKLLLA